MTVLCANDIVLLTESKRMLLRIIDEFDRVCRWRKLKVNAVKSKVMAFKRTKEQTIDFPNHIEWGQRLYRAVRYCWERRRWRK